MRKFYIFDWLLFIGALALLFEACKLISMALAWLVWQWSHPGINPVHIFSRFID